VSEGQADVGTAVRQVLGDSLSYLNAAALRVAVRFGVADALADGPRSIAEIAQRARVPAGPLGRVLRLLGTRGVFRVGPDDIVHPTVASGLLRSDSPLPLRDAVLLFTDQMYWLPSGRLDEAVRDDGTVFGELFGAQFFQYLTTDTERARLVDRAMTTMSMTEQTAIVAAYDFPERGTVVDVAGGQGGFLRTILTAHPGLRGVLFDRAEVLAGHVLADTATEGRYEIVTGDFLESVPAGADIYVLKRIVHDKSESEARAILRTVRAAMSEDSRLLVVDAVVPQGESPSPSLALADVLMLAVFEGRERDEAEYRELLAGENLKLSRIVPTQAALSIIEAVSV